MTVDYAHLKWPEIDKLKSQNCVVLVPFGATEEHGHSGGYFSPTHIHLGA